MLLGPTRDAAVTRIEPLAVERRGGRWRRIVQAPPRNHCYAIHRAGCDTKLTAGAKLCNDRMHLLSRADDGIDGTRRQTLRAADASALINLGNQGGALNSIRGIERKRLPV